MQIPYFWPLSMKFNTRFLFLLLLLPFELFSKGNTVDKPDTSPKGKFIQDINFLCMDTLKGRFTGSEGEKIAGNYIQNRFESLGLKPFKGRYQWDFTVSNGAVLARNAYVKICDKKLNIGTDIVFMPYGTGDEFMGSCMPNVDEDNNVWLVPLSRVLSQKNSMNPHQAVYDYARYAAQGGCKALMVFNDMPPFNDLPPLGRHKFETLDIPVALMNAHSYEHFIKPNLKRDWILVETKLNYEENSSTGSNVMGYIDNKMPLTIVVCANYDHIGNVGGNFPGADNNASGVAGLFYLAEQILTTKLSAYNFLFIAFSGKEQNLQGSSSFLKQNESWLNSFASVINLDMIGRYRSTSKEIFVSGVGTSPLWPVILPKVNLGYTLQIDSSGYGYSDLTSFYLREVPGLRFSTGYHNDYQSEGDIPSKISATGALEVLNVVMKTITELNLTSQPVFTPTTNYVPKLKSMRVDLGIIPDFTYMNDGIKIGACVKSKIAGHAGFLSGDVIIKIGEFDVIDYDDYVKAIRKSSDEKETVVVVRRGGEEYKFFVLLN